MDRSGLLELRGKLYEAYKRRVELGDFDTNAADVRLSLEASIMLVDRTLVELKRQDVLKKIKPKSA